MKRTAIILLVIATFFQSCDKEEVIDENLNVPTNYEFLRNGETSVSYPGQTSRLAQLKEIKSYLTTADGGATISEDALLDMFKNTDGNGGGNFSQDYSKDLFSKTFEADQSYFSNLMSEMATNSSSEETASNGTAGRLQRGNGNSVLLDAGGREYTQIIEKGLMGSTFINQILNNYLTLTTNGVADEVNNTDVDPEENYTTMEHHWDEAFGYTAMPVNFSSNWTGDDQSFWANYAIVVDEVVPNFINDLMSAFKTGRAAIVAQQYDVKDEQIDKINTLMEKLAAGASIHYINSTINGSTTADKLHALSESFAFARALRQIPVDKSSFLPSELNSLLIDDFGTNFWTLILEEDFTTLKSIKNTISSKVGLDSYKDAL